MRKSSPSLRLKEIMQQRNLRQIDILNAAKPYCDNMNVKLGRNDLSQYIAGKVEPGNEKLTVLSLALNVSELWLMGYDVPITSGKSYTVELPSVRYTVPCDVGDTVYVATAAGLEPVTIDKIIIRASGLQLRGRRFTRPSFDILYLDLEDFERKWFLKAEDAER